MFGVSRWTLLRRVREYGLEHLSRFSVISDTEIDSLVEDFMSKHGHATGETYITGYLRALGYHIPRRRIRASINRVDPVNTALRWGALVSRRTYHVPWPNSLWHIDGHHSLIRWSFVIHGCIDGKSRKIMYLSCNTNNKAETVLRLFEKAISEHDGLWPSRIRVDYGVENVLICDAMVSYRGEGRGSFIAGSSTRNQRIERLWRDVFRCVCLVYYYTFYAMEQTGILDLENPIHMFALHLVYKPRINLSLQEFMQAFNNHRLSTQHGWTPNQIWINGMMDQTNPLRIQDPNSIDDSLSDNQYYGEDPHGPISVGNGDNNVIVSPVEIPHTSEITRCVYQHFDPNQPSTDFGIEIFTQVLTFVVNKLEELM
jgi:hypothetical protein